MVVVLEVIMRFILMVQQVLEHQMVKEVQEMLIMLPQILVVEEEVTLGTLQELVDKVVLVLLLFVI